MRPKFRLGQTDRMLKLLALLKNKCHSLQRPFNSAKNETREVHATAYVIKAYLVGVVLRTGGV